MTCTVRGQKLSRENVIKFSSSDTLPMYTRSSGKVKSKTPHMSVDFTLKGGRLPLFHVPVEPSGLIWTWLTHPPIKSEALMVHESTALSAVCHTTAGVTVQPTHDP